MKMAKGICKVAASGGTAALMLAGIFLFLVPVCRAKGPSANQALRQLKQLTIEQLADLEVTTVSKKPEKLADAAAAVFVISGDDIRRGGFTSIAEALRLVPGLEVAHIDANKWAISSRGFNAWFANKLLVLMDGRSVYTPLFSGVYWDVQDTLLEDIDRIEVIRGPGATLWGANAVNGVINIITKKAQDTQGGLITAGGGNLEQGFGAARYGGKIGKHAWYRGYAKYFNRASFEDIHGNDADDDWDAGRAGFRLDWDRSAKDALTLQGDIYTGNSGTTSLTTGSIVPRTFADNADLSGGNLLGRWTHILTDTSDLSLQAYYDRTVRNMQVMSEDRDTVDIDFQHTFRLGGRQQVIWGLGYRMTRDDITNSETIFFDPDSRTENLFSGFIQDKIVLIPDKLDLTVGSKFEHNDYSGFEIQPSARLRWTPVENHTLWAAVSRAVRTPSRADRDANIKLGAFRTGPTVNALMIRGNSAFDSEEVIAYEAGYRLVPMARLSLDFASFYNVYRDLRTTVPGMPIPPFTAFPPPAARVLPQNIVNKFHEDAYGAEIASNLQLADWWKLSLGYTWINLHLFADAAEKGLDLELNEGGTPRNQFSAGSYLDLPGNLQFDTLLFFVDDLPDLNVPSYTRVDVRLGWQPLKHLAFSLKLENLLDNRHPEYTDTQGIRSTEVPRSIYGKITWRF